MDLESNFNENFYFLFLHLRKNYRDVKALNTIVMERWLA